MSRAVTEFPWERTSLGAMPDWPPALTIAVRMMLSSHFPKAIAWGPELITIYNTAFATILGQKENVLGSPFAQVWPEAWNEIGPIAKRAMSGQATFIEDFPLTINRNGYDEQAYFTFCYSPIYDEHGRISGMMDTVIETTSRVETQRRTDFLNKELQHRIKNMLGSVSAITNQTLRNAQSIETARTALLNRIETLATAHGKILERQSDSAELFAVVTDALKPHIGNFSDQITMSGPRIIINERQSLALALAVNELATNALKYGALKYTDGGLTIEWGLDEDGGAGQRFFFTWAETTSQPVKAPERRGFGSTLMCQIVPVDFAGKAQLDYADFGVTYRLRGSWGSLPGQIGT